MTSDMDEHDALSHRLMMTYVVLVHVGMSVSVSAGRSLATMFDESYGGERQ